MSTIYISIKRNEQKNKIDDMRKKGSIDFDRKFFPMEQMMINNRRVTNQYRE